MTNKHSASLNVWPIVLLFGLLCAPALSFADSDGQIAFGSNFLVYARFSDQNTMRLSLVPFVEDRPLSVTSFIDTPTRQSYVSMLTWQNYLFVLGSEPELYVYKIDQNGMNLLKTISARGLESVPYYDHKGGVTGYMTMNLNKERLCLYSNRNDSFIDLSSAPKDWKIETSPQKLPRESDIGWTWKHRGAAWLPRWGDCVPGKRSAFCLTAGSTSNKSSECCTKERTPGQSYYTDLILTRRSRELIDSLLVIGTRLETID